MVICTLDGSVSPRNLLQSISRSCPVLTRLQLDYRQYHFNETQFNDGAVNFDDLRSILACTSMTYLHVMVLLALNLSDSDVLDMAQAWPRLRSLELGSCNHTTENAKHLSLSSLFILTRHCPDIKCITLDINAGVSEGFLAETGTGRVARLDSLNVGHYIPESDGEAFLARLLGQICEPQCRLNYLENRRLTDKSHEELRSRWENVKMLIRHFSELYSTIRSLELENASLRALAR
ncbi:hypothetical protein VKT23_008032 [Stygiomarasmius scandens]|uniref:Uncharacterized protein n=1 Tax=Marasmiellus scandens TaxID=2682957 RepID=A0ABR1JLV2_9AGAR